MISSLTSSSYAELIDTLPQSVRAQENQLPVRNDLCRSQFFLHPERPSRVILLFHGFTAAPYQFVPMAQRFYQAGYNVIIPLLPGHGQAGTWSAQTPPPLPSDPATYQQFAQQWLDQARQLGDQVVVGGLSAGGAIAAWLAMERSTDIEKSFLLAPYLSNANMIIDLVVKNSNGYFQWQPPVPDEQSIGYSGFTFDRLRAVIDIGQEAFGRSTTSMATPMFIISTEMDQAVKNSDHQQLYDNVRQHHPNSWYYCFDHALNIPHTMTTQAEGNAWESVLSTIAKAYVESDLSWEEITAIALEMLDGKTCDAAVNDLNFQAKASPDLPAMMTMIDKRQIFIDQNPTRSED